MCCVMKIWCPLFVSFICIMRKEHHLCLSGCNAADVITDVLSHWRVLDKFNKTNKWLHHCTSRKQTTTHETVKLILWLLWTLLPFIAFTVSEIIIPLMSDSTRCEEETHFLCGVDSHLYSTKWRFQQSRHEGTNRV